MESIKLPRLNNVILQDWQAFILVFLSCLISVFSLLAFLVFEYPYNQYAWYEIIGSVLAIASISVVMFPVVIWWYTRIVKTYKNAVVIEGVITKKLGCGTGLYPYIGIQYEFSFQGDIYTRMVDVVNNKKANYICNTDKVTVLFDSKTGLSFIKEVLD